MRNEEKFPLWWSVKLPENLKPNSANTYHFLVHMHKKKTLTVYGGKEYEEYFISTEYRYDEVLVEIDYLETDSYRVYDNCMGVYVDYKTLSAARSAAHRCMQKYFQTELKTDDVTLSYIYSFPNKIVYKGQIFKR